MNFPPRIASAMSHRFCLLAFSLSFVLRYFLISSLTLSLAHWLFSILFSLHVIFFSPPVSLSMVDFLFHTVIVRKDAWKKKKRKDAWNNFCALKFVEIVLCPSKSSILKIVPCAPECVF